MRKPKSDKFKPYYHIFAIFSIVFIIKWIIVYI